MTLPVRSSAVMAVAGIGKKVVLWSRDAPTHRDPIDVWVASVLQMKMNVFDFSGRKLRETWPRDHLQYVTSKNARSNKSTSDVRMVSAGQAPGFKASKSGSDSVWLSSGVPWKGLFSVQMATVLESSTNAARSWITVEPENSNVRI